MLTEYVGLLFFIWGNQNLHQHFSLILQDTRIRQHYGVDIGERFDERCIGGVLAGIQHDGAPVAGGTASQTIQC